MESDEKLQQIAAEIAANHRQIIDDWCKAYLAQLYEENGTIKPGDFILNEQVPTYHKGRDMMVKKYWFEKKEKDAADNLTKQEIEYIISWGKLTDSEYGLDDGDEWELFQRLVKLKERLAIDEKSENG